MAKTIVKRTASSSSPKSVRQLLREGYRLVWSTGICSTDETSQRGTAVFAKSGSATPIEETPEFKAAPAHVQLSLRGCRVEGRTLDLVEVPYRARFSFGRPQPRRATA